MKIGVVGKPNVGKSTFFKALTLAPVEIANYPFVTIKPNKGFGHVRVRCPETSFNTRCNPKHGFCLKGWRYVPVEIIDVAGLVPGAHEGKGLGNAFLDDLREADILIHVVDAAGSTNEKGEPIPPGSRDPMLDISFLEHELDMWIFGILKRGWERFARKVQQEQLELEPSIEKQLSGLKVTQEQVRTAIQFLKLKEVMVTSWTDQQLFELARLIRKKSKPILIAANKLDLQPAAGNLNKLKEAGYPVVGCSAECELALREAALHKLIEYAPGDSSFTIINPIALNEKQKAGLEFLQRYLSSHGSTGVQEAINRAAFELLNCIAVFPVANNKLQDKDGNVLPDCFLVPKGTTALQFAFMVHTDLGNKFVKARHMQSQKIVGKEHVLENLDVLEIITA